MLKLTENAKKSGNFRTGIYECRFTHFIITAQIYPDQIATFAFELTFSFERVVMADPTFVTTQNFSTTIFFVFKQLGFTLSTFDC